MNFRKRVIKIAEIFATNIKYYHHNCCDRKKIKMYFHLNPNFWLHHISVSKSHRCQRLY